MFCQNCGKQISSIEVECPYCKTKVNSNTSVNNEIQQQNYNNNICLNKTLYNCMNGKPVPVWKFILGAILLVGGIIIAFSAVL